MKRSGEISKLSFRNRRGDLVDIPSVAATRVKNEFGAILEQATLGGAVAITRHDAPKAVLVSYDEFQSLIKARAHALDDLTTQFEDLIARMQTPRAKAGMKVAFEASPTELGQAAVKAARRPSSKK